jgi:hypothetical protein
MGDKTLPKMDSIQELAHFWDSHDVTDFESELEEAPGVFDRNAVTLQLQPNEAEAVKKLAQAKGLSEAVLLHSWIAEKIDAEIGN